MSPSFKKIFKTITFIFAIFYLISTCFYSSFIIGTLFHELTHKYDFERMGYNVSEFRVKYDGSGETFAYAKNPFLVDTNKIEITAYFNGTIISIFMFGISFTSILILILYNKN